MTCQKCGKELNDDFQVCPYCGGQIIRNVNTNQQQFQPTPQMPQSGSYSYGNGQYAQPKKNSGVLGILSLIFGIIGMATSCLVIGIIPAIAGIVLGIIGIAKKNGKGKGIAGIVCGIIGVIIFLIMMSSNDSSTTDSPQLTPEVNVESQIEENEKKDTKSETAKKEEPEKTGTENKEVSSAKADRKAFIESCEKFDYKKIARNPDDYIGKNFKVTVQIYSKSEGGLFTESYMKAYTDDGSGYYFDKMIYVFDEQDENSDDYVNVLENDIITVYGTFEGMEDTTNMLNGEKSKDVALHMKYAKLVSEGE